MNDDSYMIPPGTYKLNRDVTNPAPDRRHSRDWRHFPNWEAGWEFLVEERRVDRTDGEGFYTAIRLVGHRWSHHAVGPGHAEWYAALEAALVPCEKSDDALFAQRGIEEGFAQWLLVSKKLDRNQLGMLWTEYQQDAPVLTPEGLRIGRLLSEMWGSQRDD